MLGAAIAGAAIATSLIESLIAKRILSEAEARVSVGDGQNRVFQVTVGAPRKRKPPRLTKGAAALAMPILHYCFIFFFLAFCCLIGLPLASIFCSELWVVVAWPGG